MKSIHIKVISFLLLLSISCSKEAYVSADKLTKEDTTESTGQVLSTALGKGINVSKFEFDFDSTNPATISAADLQKIKDLGFDHVRIPVNWEFSTRSMSAPPYTIEPWILTRVKTVVDLAVAKGLKVIIDMHHHNALMNDPTGQQPRFLKQWEQLANYFKPCPSTVYFEILNEPTGNMTPALWNTISAEALQKIRSTAGNNITRKVLLGTANGGGLYSIGDLVIPADNNLILTIHYYAPFQFTHQGAPWEPGAGGWVVTNWYDSQYERNVIQDQFEPLFQKIAGRNISVHIGEFGTYHSIWGAQLGPDLPSRTRWAKYIARKAEESGFDWTYWDYNGEGFGLFPKPGVEITELISALTTDPMPAATTVNEDNIHTTDFANNQSNGWWLVNNFPGAASVNYSGGTMNVATTNPGAEDWHIQLMHGGIYMEDTNMYQVSFKAFTTSPSAVKTVKCFIAKSSSPWTIYTEINTFNVSATEREFRFIFTARQTDITSNLVFSIGKSGTTGLSIRNVTVKKLWL